MSVVSEVTSKIGLHNSRAAQSLHRYLQGGPAWGGSIANTPANTSTSSSITSADATAASSSHSKGPSDTPLLPLPTLSNPHSCNVAVEEESSGKGSASKLRSSSSSIGGLRDLMHGGSGSESRGRMGFSSFGASVLGGSGSLIGRGLQDEDGRGVSDGAARDGPGTGPAVLAGRRMPHLSVP